MCILELITFSCSHSVSYAQRYHTIPGLKHICFEPLLTISRRLPFECPRCRLRDAELRGFPYVGVPFGVVVREDGLLGKGKDSMDGGEERAKDGGEEDGEGEWEIIVAENEKGEGDRVLDEIEAGKSEGGTGAGKGVELEECEMVSAVL